MADLDVRLEGLKRDLKQARDELRVQMHLAKADARDELRVQMNLAKADARDEWESLEKKWDEFEGRMDKVEGAAEDAAKDVRQALSALGEELKDGYKRIRDAL